MARLLSGRGEGWIQATQPGDFVIFWGGPSAPGGRVALLRAVTLLWLGMRKWCWARGTMCLLLGANGLGFGDPYPKYIHT